MMLAHGTCIAIGDQGVLLFGPPGSGKSDLALRLIDAGAMLVGDDYVELTRDGDTLVATGPETIAGRMEVRGVGIVSQPFQTTVTVSLVVDLVPRDAVERLPEPTSRDFLGLAVRTVRLHAFDASTPIKLRLLLTAPEGSGHV